MLAKFCTINTVKPEPMKINLKCSYHIGEMNYEHILMFALCSFNYAYMCHDITLYNVKCAVNVKCLCPLYCSEAGGKSPGPTVIELYLNMGIVLRSSKLGDSVPA